VIVAVVAGAVILFPSLALLFRLVLGGTLGTHPASAIATASPSSLVTASSTNIAARTAGAAFIAAIAFLTVADTAWARRGRPPPARLRDRRVHRPHPRPDRRGADA